MKELRKEEESYTVKIRLQKGLLPQKDFCIDILCRSKDETIDRVIESLSSNIERLSLENVLFVYLLRGLSPIFIDR